MCVIKYTFAHDKTCNVMPLSPNITLFVFP